MIKTNDHTDFLIDIPFAHRGLHRPGNNRRNSVPENSIQSFDLAIKNGFAIEMDLQATEDLEIVVFHDDCLQRLTKEKGLVAERKLEFLKTVTLDNGENIPSFTEVLNYINGRVPILVEIKESKKLKENKEHFFGNLAKQISNYSGQIGLMSFDIDILTHLKKINFRRDISIGLTTDFPSFEGKEEKYENDKIQKKIQQLGLDFISQNWKGIKNNRITDIKDNGLIIVCWTVTSKKIEESVKNIADNITFEGYKPK